MQHYRLRNGLLYATTQGGEDCLYIRKGHGINGETLRELMISEIETKGHHTAERNLWYASEYIYWPEMRKDFGDFVRQCKLCLANKERNTLPTGDAQTLPFPSEIFSSYAIDLMGPFTKTKGQDSVLVVVDRAVGFSWLIPTSVTATALQTTDLLRHHILRLMEYLPRPSVILTHDSPLSSGNRQLRQWGSNTSWLCPAITKRMGRLNRKSGSSRLP